MNFEAWPMRSKTACPTDLRARQLLANIRILDAVTRSAAADGKPIAL